MELLPTLLDNLFDIDIPVGDVHHYLLIFNQFQIKLWEQMVLESVVHPFSEVEQVVNVVADCSIVHEPFIIFEQEVGVQLIYTL